MKSSLSGPLTRAAACSRPVSYTHLDVYKRQSLYYELGLVVLIGLFGICCGKWKYAWKGAAFYALVVLLTFWIMDTMTGTWRTMFIAFLGLFHKVYPLSLIHI